MNETGAKTPVYLSLGSNLGNRIGNLQEAVRRLPPSVTVLAQSPVYQTKPWGYTKQPNFLNQVIFGETSCTPEELLTQLKAIEIRIGRKPTFRYGPRVVDLDILFYGDQIITLPNLEIPHPRLYERAFVLVPLNDLAPDLRHPVSGQTIHEMVTQIDISGISPYPLSTR
ncbi:MAG TPA: 2-amino-4-hydroxy-6-hydroxymethyldihydropteridine diphosphokinase [Anaerolineales bacterium]|nr:2-amino-4-hydroxy-6-hydroxymethyldihydropteridine diphosphokinase [Anaerolineales bacterium]